MSLTKIRQIEVVETTDAGPGRISAAAKSLASWFRFRCDVLQRERELFRRELQSTSFDPVHEGELRVALQENQAEQAALDKGWENSSLRRKLEENAESKGAPAGGVERRSIAPAFSPAAVRADAVGTLKTTAKTMFGYGAVFGVWAEMGFFREKIAPGAFAKALPKSDVRLLLNHDANHLFGRSSAATLELAENSIGLRFVGYLLPSDPESYALARRIDRRDITGCSFSFIIEKDTWTLARRPGELDERTILEIKELFDVGPVTYPAYRQTNVSVTFEQVPARAAPLASDIVSADDYFADVDEQIFLESVTCEHQRKKEQDRKYRLAGRIIGRCKSQLLQA